MKRSTYLNWRRRAVKTIKFLFIFFLALLGAAVLVPTALSYLSSHSEKGIAIRAAPASEIWELQGAFDLNKWKTANASGFSIHNKSHRDLWVYYEYTGALKQVFKNSDPVLITAGSTQEITLPPLDDKDSPRLLNPADLLENYDKEKSRKCGGSLNWKTFSGTVKIHTLNHYAVLETTPINIGGDVLWKLLFARKYGLDASHYYQDCWKQQSVLDQDSRQNNKADTDSESSPSTFSGTKLADGAPRGDIQESTRQLLAKSEDALSRADSYEPAVFLEPVLQAIDQIAPGLWEDRLTLLNLFYSLKSHLQQMRDLLAQYREKVFRLEREIVDLRQQNEALNQEIIDIRQNMKNSRPSTVTRITESVANENRPGESAGNQPESDGGNAEQSGIVEQPATEGAVQSSGSHDSGIPETDSSIQASSSPGSTDSASGAISPGPASGSAESSGSEASNNELGCSASSSTAS